MTNEQKILMDLIKYALGSRKIPEELSGLSLEEKKNVILYAGKQGLFPFLQYYPAFLEGELKAQTFQYLARACYVDTVQLAEVERVLDEFEKRGIFCIPLKGIRTKQLYPSTELRSMGDLDILYKPEQTKELKEAMNALGFSCNGEAAKHDHYEKDGMIVEMHKTLLSAQSRAFRYFLGVWDRAQPREGRQFVYDMKLEDHYLFTLYHLIEHFIRGGIGIRMVLDIYILSQVPDMDWTFVNEELKKLGIDKFEQKIRSLALQWFQEGTKEEEDLWSSII